MVLSNELEKNSEAITHQEKVETMRIEFEFFKEIFFEERRTNDITTTGHYAKQTVEASLCNEEITMGLQDGNGQICSEQGLLKRKVKDLKGECKRHKVTMTGVKLVLVQKLLSHYIEKHHAILDQSETDVNLENNKDENQVETSWIGEILDETQFSDTSWMEEKNMTNVSETFQKLLGFKKMTW